jgi:glycosyltransferase involved in cell wall biosynthesis
VHGGFGYLTRSISTSLASRGFDVSVVTRRRKGQLCVESIDGVKVYGYKAYGGYPQVFSALASRVSSLEIYRLVDSDIYHSQAVSYNTLAAQYAETDKLHIITFQDPYDLNEWRRISKVDSRYKLTIPHRIGIELERRILSRACKRADALYSQAHFLVEKACKLYKISRRIGFLPNPVNLPKGSCVKSDTPMVCFLARWDPQKRVEIFFELARLFPSVRFVAMGRGHDLLNDNELRKKYRKVPNLELTGFVSEETKSRVLAESWALINTSIREALPVSFLEALAHKTTIISGENPDNLTVNYGYLVHGNDFVSAVQRLLVDTKREEKGEKGRRLIEKVYESSKVVDQHVRVYEELSEGTH